MEIEKFIKESGCNYYRLEYFMDYWHVTCAKKFFPAIRQNETLLSPNQRSLRFIGIAVEKNLHEAIKKSFENMMDKADYQI